MHSIQDKGTFAFKESAELILLKKLHAGIQRTCCNLRVVEDFAQSPIVTRKNWVQIASMLSVATEEQDLRHLEHADFVHGLEPARKKAVRNLRQAKEEMMHNGSSEAFHSQDVNVD